MAEEFRVVGRDDVRGATVAEGVAKASGLPQAFADEVARVLGGAGGALTPEQGAAVLGRELVR